MADEPEKKTKSTRGFASLTAEERRAVASKGGKSVPAEKRAFSRDNALATAMGSKGGKSVAPEKRAFSTDKDLASAAGRAGARGRSKPKPE